MHDNCRDLGMSTDPRNASSDRAEPNGARHQRKPGLHPTWKHYRRKVLGGAFGNLKEESYALTKAAR